MPSDGSLSWKSHIQRRIVPIHRSNFARDSRSLESNPRVKPNPPTDRPWTRKQRQFVVASCVVESSLPSFWISSPDVDIDGSETWQRKKKAKALIEDEDMRYNPVVFSLVLMVATAFFATASSSHPELRSALSTKGQWVLPNTSPARSRDRRRTNRLSIWFLGHATGHEEDGGVGERSRQRRTWPCCDRCGGCTKSTPPQCQCQDMVRSCHPSCRHCVRSPLSVSPPLYQCMDRIPNHCRRRCSPEPLLAQ
ncbi:hypothetical protein GW17_00022612 [Ensete ventricosum]|nr:hypothetical protein GW17_00022612 [Ensete ventricosum]